MYTNIILRTQTVFIEPFESEKSGKRFFRYFFEVWGRGKGFFPFIFMAGDTKYLVTQPGYYLVSFPIDLKKLTFSPFELKPSDFKPLSEQQMTTIRALMVSSDEKSESESEFKLPELKTKTNWPTPATNKETPQNSDSLKEILRRLDPGQFS